MNLANLKGGVDEQGYTYKQTRSLER
jgi:hypothetical protein